ncbi:ATP-binding cassette domain-containing protein [Roseateles sp. DXS20W]|uniref:ATP-binding cassette domain-containing protein n=1 Tax=Pelomonas lactea TaxID=3299030 RepID=A0ABW7GSH8_9BURK
MLIRMLWRNAPWRMSAALALGLAGGVSYAVALVWIESAIRQGGDAWGGAAVVLTILLMGLLQFGASTASARVLLLRIFSMRADVAAKVLRAPLRRLEQLGSRALLSSLVDDVQLVAQGVWALPGALLQGGVCVAAYVYIGMTSPAALGLLLGTQALLFALLAALMARFGRLSDAAATDRRRVVDALQLLVAQLPLLKQGHTLQAAYAAELLSPALSASWRSTVSTQRVAALMDALSKAGFLGVVALLLMGPTASLTAPVLAQVLMAFLFAAAPFSALLNSMQTLAEAQRAWRRLESLEWEAEPAPSLPSWGDAPRRLELRGVACSHRRADGGVEFALNGVDLDWGLGSIVLLRGGNGSGKTTLARLAAGLVAPERGQLLRNGQAVAAEQVTNLRGEIGALWTGQEAQMAYLPADGLAAIASLWDSFGLTALLPLRAGWHDIRTLSAGQRARVQLLALLALERRFLVLDEWAANQDAHHRQIFYRELLPALRESGHGVLLIAHDAEAELLADQVVDMQSFARARVALGPVQEAA